MYTLDEIIHLTGIPANTASEVCRILCGEGYLIFDESSGKYSLTDDVNLLGKIREVREQMSKEETAQQICSKIEDIITLGKPLALSEKGLGKSVKDIGIPGLNIIFGGFTGQSHPSRKDDDASQKSSGLPRGHCILIKGAPGTGKTTMGMQIAVHLAPFRSLFLTFEEDISQLCRNLDVYCKEENPEDQSKDSSGDNPQVGWDKSLIKKVTRSITKIRTPSAWENTEVVLQELCSILDRELPQLVVIDSISRFRDLGGETKVRLVVRRLIRTLKIRGITSIFLGEDRGEANSFEEYETDGIIQLEWIRDQLSLSVVKMRGLKSYKGPHSAAMLTKHDLEKPEHSFISEENYSEQPEIPHLRAGFNVFPEISVYKDMKDDRENSKNTFNDNSKEPVSTGITGLDRLLPIGPHHDRKGFKKGETVLIIGSAGSGKTLMALHFILEGYLGEIKDNPAEQEKKEIDKEEKKKKLAVWINLEGDIGTLKFATAGFESDHKKNLDKMIKSAKQEKNENEEQKDESQKGKEYFKFFNFPPINLDLNKIVYTLESIHKSDKYTIDRIVIDSITELERAKGGGQPEVKAFLAGLIQFLRDREITTIFISRSDTFFRSIDKIEEQVSSLVDLIICIRNFDMQNQISKGIYIQKARGRPHNSKIMRMTIESRKGIKVEDSGWDVENLLAGDTSVIQEPRVFFKLFYENSAEKEINEAIIKDFDKDRYPGNQPSFTLVEKASIQTEFWSFRGQYSAGHANTRVLSIADHVISAFRDNDKLTELKDYVKNELLQDIRGDKHLIRLYNPPKENPDSEGFIIDAIPCYRDYGVMLYKPDYRYMPVDNGSKQKYANLMKELEPLVDEMNGNECSDIAWLKKRYTWDNLLEWMKNCKKSDTIIPFAFPSLEKKSEFVAFFMELLWSHGGDIYNIPIDKTYQGTGYRLKFKDIIRKRIIYDFCSCGNYLDPSIEEIDPENEIIHRETIDEFIEHLKKNGEDGNKSVVCKEIEKRFDEYVIGQGYIKFKGFMEWTVENIAKENKRDEVRRKVIRCDDEPFKETIKLIMRLIHEAGVRNPIHGDFRKDAILSRNWYSRLYKMHKDERKLLPLPLAKNKLNKNDKKGYHRSVSCITYWCLAMLKNALSPEIGGNFIESMKAPEYYKRRLEFRAGMPSMNWELDKEEFIKTDPESYSIFNRIVENGIKYEKVNKKISDAYWEEKKEDKYNEILKECDYAVLGMQNVGLPGNIDEEIKGNINRRIFYPKTRQTRIAFYQVEQVLHYQLRQILIPDPGKEKVAFLGGIYDEIKYLCLPKDSKDKKNLDAKFKKKEKEPPENWDRVFKKITNELRLHIILELLMYFYHEDELEGR